MSSATLAPVDAWSAAGSGNWSVAANWSLGRTPKTGDDVDIAATTPLTVTYDIGNSAIGALVLTGAALDLAGGGLLARGGATLTNATIAGAKSIVIEGASAVQGLTVGGSAFFANFGVLTQSAGTVAIGDSASSAAHIVNETGASWIVSDASGMTQDAVEGWRFVNRGLFQKTSGSGVALIQASFYSTGTIASAGGGDIEFDGAESSLSGTYIGSGMVDYGPDGISWVGNVNVTASTCQTNWGKVELVGTMTMNDGSTIMNASGAKWYFDGDSSLVLAAGQSAGPVIDGPGVIAKVAGTGTSVVSIDVQAQGAVGVDTGTLAFEGASSLFTGPIVGAGTFEIDGGAAQVGPGAAVSVANWTLAGGETTLGQSIVYKGAFSGEAGATLAPNGFALTLTGAATLSGLSLAGSGDLTLESTVSVSGATIGGTTILLDRGDVTQSGGNVTVGDSTATAAAQLTIGYGGVWDIADGSCVLIGVDSASTLTIGTGAGSGLLEKSGGGTSKIFPSVTNNGLDGAKLEGIEAAAGLLDFIGAVGGTGSDNIVGAGTLEFDSAVGAKQTVSFSGAAGALDLTDLSAFKAAIVGFDTTGSDDALLIGGGWTYVGANEGTTSTALTFSQGPASATLTLTGDYTGVFSAQPLTGGGLKITY